MSKHTQNGDGDGRDAFGRVFRLKAADDLKQRHVALWNRTYLGHGFRAALADERQAALEAAIEAGWIVEPETRYEDVTDGATGKTERRYYFDGVLVDDLRAAEVALYGQRVNALFEEVMTVPNV